MKTLRVVLLLTAAVMFGGRISEAQDCGAWANVSGWKITFSLSGTGSGTDPITGLDWTDKESGSASGWLVPGQPCTWWWNDAAPFSGSGSVNNQGSIPCPTGETITLIGNEIASLNTAASTHLTIDADSYSLTPFISMLVKETVDACGHTSSGPPQQFALAPFAPPLKKLGSATSMLPSKVGILQGKDITFPDLIGSCEPCVPGNWTLSYTLTPIYLSSQTVAKEPPNQSRTIIGVGEWVNLKLNGGDDSTAWGLIGPGSLSQQGAEAIYKADDGNTGGATIEACDHDICNTINLTVIAPKPSP